DLDEDAARARVEGHERGRAIRLDLSDAASVSPELDAADLVVCLLPPFLQGRVAASCVEHGCHMVSASYRSADVAALDEAARERGVTLLTELGLDPGIDLMSAQRIIDAIQRRGGTVDRFLSYGGGLPEPSFEDNPLRYCVTWNPRNVVMAADLGARYLRRGRVQLEPWHRVFAATWPVDVPNLGTFDAYANRDSINYRAIHGIDHVQTLLRGTLRHPGYCAIWHQIVRLGLPAERLVVPRLGERTWAELVTMFLPADAVSEGADGAAVRAATATFLGLPDDDPRLRALSDLGLFSDETIGGTIETPAQAMIGLLQKRLPLPDGVRDMVVLHHEIDALIPVDGTTRRERTLSTFVHYGDPGGTPGGITAMAETVGLPMALGATMLLDGRLRRRGCVGPTESDVFEPILDELETRGLRFEETTTVVDEPL
ncbi:MAG: saccharopine dehydrogenase C-terminal domain-containing protein, partial [Acidobacteriota bacterium]